MSCHLFIEDFPKDWPNPAYFNDDGNCKKCHGTIGSHSHRAPVAGNIHLPLILIDCAFIVALVVIPSTALQIIFIWLLIYNSTKIKAPNIP
jgi:hypothetical protein